MTESTSPSAPPVSRRSRRVLWVPGLLRMATLLVALSIPAWALHQTHVLHVSTMHDEAPTIGVWAASWAVAMTAMMLPVAAPLLAAHRFVVQRSRFRGVHLTMALSVGYMTVWVATAIVAAPLAVWIWPAAVGLAGSDTARFAPSAAVLVAGLFQLSALKARCLRVCQTPLTFVAGFDFSRGALYSYRVGLQNGAYCVGCCWALMLLHLAIGTQGVLAMIALSLLMLLERLWAGIRMARSIGWVFIGCGALLAASVLI